MTSALTLVRYGRYRTSADADFTTISAGTLRMTHQGAPSSAVWLTHLGAWMGRNEALTPTTLLALYESGTIPSGTTPDALLAQTTAINPSTAMTSASGGASYEVAIDGDYVLIIPSKVYAIGALPLSEDLGLGSYTDSFTVLSGNRTLYNKSGIAVLPDPFVPSSSSSGYGRVSTWAKGWQNEAPIAPADRIPTGTVYSLTPTFEGSFRDLNGSYGTTTGTGLDQGDVLNQFRIQVREVGGDTLFWNTTLAATSTEQTNDLFSRTYAGTTLVRGTDYEWRTQVSDQADEWGEWSSWLTFTPADAGVITLDGDPTGKQDVITGIDFEGKWTHATSLAMEEVRVRLYDSNTHALLQQSGDIAKAAVSSASPGTAFTVTWADTGFADLDWGRNYYFAMSGKDSDDVWSNYYTSATPFPTFYTNSAPTVPTNLSPNNGRVYTTPPLIEANWSDVDDTTATGLTGLLGIKPDLAYGPYTGAWATYNATTGKWERQLDADDMKVYEIQRYRIVSVSPPTGGTYTITYDGQTTGTINHNASAATVEAALTALSNITVVGVADEVPGSGAPLGQWMLVSLVDDTDNHPQITLNIGSLTGGSGHSAEVETVRSGGTYYGTWLVRASSYDGTLWNGSSTSSSIGSPVTTFIYSDGNSMVIDSPTDEGTVATASMTVQWTTSDQQKYRVRLYADGTETIVYDSGEITSTTSEHVIPYGSYSNDTDYDLWVWAADSLAIEASSLIDITVDYDPPDNVTNVQVSVVFADGMDPVETAVMITHDPTEYPLVDAGDGGFVAYLYFRSADGGPDQARIQLTDAVTNPNSTTFIDYHAASGYEYTYEVVTVVRVGLDELESDPSSGTATLDLGQNHVITVLGNGGTYRAVMTNVTAKAAPPAMVQDAIYQPISGGTPITVSGEQYAQVRTYEASIIADSVATAEARLAAIREVDEQRATIVICDGAGEKLYGRLVDFASVSQIGDQSGRWYTATFGIREERASEGVTNG